MSRIVRTEVGLKICSMLKEDQEDDRKLSREKTMSMRTQLDVLKDLNSQKAQKQSESRRIISSMFITPQHENNDNSAQNNNITYENLWLRDPSVDMLNTFKHKISQNCLSQDSFQKYFEDKKIQNPYILQKIKNVSQKFIPDDQQKQKYFIMKTIQKEPEIDKNPQNQKQSKQSTFFSSRITPGTTKGSNFGYNNATSRIYERLKNIKNLKEELLDERSIKLVHLEQRLEQLNMRQNKYEKERSILDKNIKSKLSDIKSYIYSPPTLQEMKRKHGDPQSLLDYDSQYLQNSQKQAIAKIHQRKYSENWKRQSELRDNKQKEQQNSKNATQSSLFNNMRKDLQAIRSSFVIKIK